MNTDDDTERLTINIPSLPNEPPPLDEARDRVTEALATLAYSIRVLEMAAWRSGWDRHVEWTTIQFKKFAEQAAQENALAARNAAAHGVADLSFVTPTGLAAVAEMKVGAPAGKTAAEIVYTYIKDYPGNTGVEIVRGLEAIGLTIHERTIRTALFRLKKDKITLVDGRWYTTEAAREMRLEGADL
jgi:hypothetical protein